ncbi:hypothetical protein H5119_19770 [Pseudoalteromonas sp. SG45-5]|uniref:hypothetical protein n=3 Tax=Pseudoalteromonas TaxID=53246 RepID=UPI0015F92277|nr:MULTISPECIES: hypothetical protein [unclassified Pseudoalteromonas]MBB1387723.1 hypothetical protein [Pseudoalteromonas sp. SG45-5]MBB1395944.1 hypothetical protein [Pseudoalteromonas sp. SG44-4]
MFKSAITLPIILCISLTACGGSSNKSEPVKTTIATKKETQIQTSNLAVGLLNMTEKELDFGVTFAKTQNNQSTQINRTVFSVDPYSAINTPFVPKVNESLSYSISIPGSNKLDIISLDSNTKNAVTETQSKSYESAVEETSRLVLVAYSALNTEQKYEIKTDFVELSHKLTDGKSIEVDIFNLTSLEGINYQGKCSDGSSIEVTVDKDSAYKALACPSGQDLISINMKSRHLEFQFSYQFTAGSKYSLLIGQNEQGDLISRLLNKASF